MSKDYYYKYKKYKNLCKSHSNGGSSSDLGVLQDMELQKLTFEKHGHIKSTKTDNEVVLKTILKNGFINILEKYNSPGEPTQQFWRVFIILRRFINILYQTIPSGFTDNSNFIEGWTHIYYNCKDIIGPQLTPPDGGSGPSGYPWNIKYPFDNLTNRDKFGENIMKWPHSEWGSWSASGLLRIDKTVPENNNLTISEYIDQLFTITFKNIDSLNIALAMSSTFNYPFEFNVTPPNMDMKTIDQGYLISSSNRILAEYYSTSKLLDDKLNDLKMQYLKSEIMITGDIGRQLKNELKDEIKSELIQQLFSEIDTKINSKIDANMPH